MRKGVLMLIIFQALMSFAQDNTIVLMQSKLPYSNQSWFSSGFGNGLQEDKIKKYWDEGKYITSAAYTTQGWLVTMARNCGYTQQTYFYSGKEPWSWVKKQWDEGYLITTIASNESKWFFVMSKGTNYTLQSYNRSSTWSELEKWIKEKWSNGYYITQATYTGTEWLIVMSKTTEYSTQGYFWAQSDNQLSSKAKSKWDEGYYLNLIEYGNGEYFVVYSKFSNGKSIAQSFNNDFSDVNGFVQKNWDKSMHIAYIGGGYFVSNTNKNTAANTSRNNAPQKLTKLYYDNHKFVGAKLYYTFDGNMLYMSDAKGNKDPDLLPTYYLQRTDQYGNKIYCETKYIPPELEYQRQYVSVSADMKSLTGYGRNSFAYFDERLNIDPSTVPSVGTPNNYGNGGNQQTPKQPRKCSTCYGTGYVPYGMGVIGGYNSKNCNLDFYGPHECNIITCHVCNQTHCNRLDHAKCKECDGQGSK